MRRRQEGQAVVAVMVVMLIVFFVAGAVAIGASTLLASQHEQGGSFRDDLTVQNAIADSVAQVAGTRSACSRTASVTLNLRLPRQDDPTTTDLLPALCVRNDGIQLNTFAGQALDWVRLSTPGTSTPWRCMTLQLSGNKVAVAFDARSSLGGWAYVDKLGVTPCDTTPPTSPAPACQKQFAGSTAPLQVSLSCQFASFGPNDNAYLHIRNSEQYPGRVFTAQQDLTDPDTGSLYLIAAATGMPKAPGPDYEEAVVLVDVNNATSLAYEGRLP